MKQEQENEVDLTFDLYYINSEVCFFGKLPLVQILPLVIVIFLQNQFAIFIASLLMFIIFLLKKYKMKIKDIFNIIRFILNPRILKNKNFSKD